MDRLMRFWCVVLIFCMTAQDESQAFIEVGEASAFSCSLQNANVDSYDRISLYKALDRTATALNTAVDTLIAFQNRADSGDAVPIEVNNPGNRISVIVVYGEAPVLDPPTPPTHSLTLSTQITDLTIADDGKYFCHFEDTTNGVADETVTRELFVITPGVITLTSLVGGVAVSSIETNDNPSTAPSTDVVAGRAVTFTCTVENTREDATLTWTIDGAAVVNSDGGITIVDSSSPAANPTDTNVPTAYRDTVSTLTFTPSLVDDIGVIAYEGNIVECVSKQTYTQGDDTTVYDHKSRQTLYVLVTVDPFGLRVLYDGTEYSNGATIDIVRGSTAEFTAIVRNARRDPTITIITDAITPLMAPTTDAELPTTDNLYFGSTQAFRFIPTTGNDGDMFQFTATNDATMLLSLATPSITINFNLLAGPDSKITSVNPVSGVATTQFLNNPADPCASGNIFTVIEGQDLPITCNTDDTSPRAIITVYQGAGGSTEADFNGQTVIGQPSQPSDDTTTGSLIDTEITRTITNPQFSDNNDIVSCVARNTINGIAAIAISSACLRFVVQPDNGGLVAINGVSISGPIATEVVVSADLSLTIADSPTTYTCSADNASPAVTIRWFYVGVSGTRFEILGEANTVDTPDDGVGGDQLIDSVSTLPMPFDFTDCGAQIECVITHPASGLETGATFEVNLDVDIGPGTPMLRVNEAGANNDDNDGIADDEDAILIEGLAYEFVCTVAAFMADPEVDIVWSLKGSDDVEIHTETDESNGVDDCTANAFTGQYTLTAARVTFADLQCGYLECTATNSVGADTVDRIYFQIWKIATSQPAMGGSGISLKYRVSGVTTDWNTIDGLTHNENLFLNVGETYEFQCTVPDVFPVGDFGAALNAPADITDPCGLGGNVPEEKDVLNIDFYFESDGRSSVSGDIEGATYTDPFFEVTDTYSYTFTAGDNCPAFLTCRADFNADGFPPSASAINTGPWITIEIDNVTPPSLTTLPLISQTSPAAAGYNRANDLGTVSDVDLTAGTTYDFSCASEPANGEPDITWNLVDNVNTASTDQLDIDNVDNTARADCTTISNTDALDPFVANFATHHNHRLQCVTSNDYGSANSYILFRVYMNPDAVTMYDGDTTGSDPPVPGDETLDTTIADEGDPILFTCVATNAHGAATVDWNLVGRGALLDTEVMYLDDDAGGDNLIDTFSTLALGTDPNYMASDSCKLLSCATDHTDTSNTPAVRTDETTLMVRVAVTNVNIFLAGSGAAALSGAPTDDLTDAHTMVGPGGTIVVIHGMTYALQARTDAITPEGQFGWYRFSNDGVTNEATLRAEEPVTEPTAISCSAAADTDDYNSLTPMYDDFDGKRIKVTADNAHGDSAVEQYVILDVQAEVKEANIAMYVSTTADTPGTKVDVSSPMDLVDQQDYYVDCVVENAIPEPDIQAKLGTVDVPDATHSTSTDLTDITSGTLESRRLTKSFMFTADYATHCGQTLSCEAFNDANTLLNDFDPANNPTPVSIGLELSVPFGPGTPELVLVGTDLDTVITVPNENAILREGLAYEFTCTVAADEADPDANIRWQLFNSAGVQIGADGQIGTDLDEEDLSLETVSNCMAEEFIGSFTLEAEAVTFAILQCGYIECTAFNSNGESAPVRMTFQIWKLPSSSIGGDGIMLEYKDSDPLSGSTYAELTHEANQHLTVGLTYDFRCTVKDVSPVAGTVIGGPATGVCGGVSSVPLDVVNINFYYDTSTTAIPGDEADDEPATYNGNNLYDLTDTWSRTILAGDNCPANIICRADVNLDGVASESTTDIPAIVVPITRVTGPTAPVLVMNPDLDNDGDETDDVAILLENTEYSFDCTASADPDATFVWTLYDMNGVAFPNDAPFENPITIDSTEDNADCTVDSKTVSYTLTSDLVTRAGLQCGYLECVVSNPGPSVPDGATDTATITFQIWPNRPTSDSIQMNYKASLSGTWIPLTVDTIQLDVDTDYDFQCIVSDVFPVADIVGSGGAALGACPGLSNVEADVLNIDFYHNNDVQIPGDEGDSEPATYVTDQSFDLTDTYTYTVMAGDACPATLACRADYFPPGNGGTASPSTDDMPFIEVEITRVSTTTSVVITPPVWGTNMMRGDDQDGVNVNGILGAVDTLTLYEGDAYTLICQSNGADPDRDIVWWLEADCNAADGNAGPPLLLGFDASETLADCVLQPEIATDISTYNNFRPTFAEYNDKCLRCSSGGVMDQYGLDIWKAPSEVIIYDGATDDDGDGETGDNDPFGAVVYVCDNEEFDFMAIAFAANPGVGDDPTDKFDIYLGLDTTGDGLPDTATRVAIADDSPDTGIAVDNVLQADIVSSAPGGVGLYDSTARVAFPVGSLTLADDNEKVLSVCDPVFGVCDTFKLELVVLPQQIDATGSAVQLSVTDPFASDRPAGAPLERTLVHGQNPVRLHLNKEYEFTCQSFAARPYTELKYSFNPSGVGITPVDTVPDPDPIGASNTQLFDSTRKVTYTPDDFEATGDEFCCTAENTATMNACVGTDGVIRQQECVTLEIVDEPDELIMSEREVGGSPGTFEEIDTDLGYTTLKSEKEFTFRCDAKRSSPGTIIRWEFTPSVTYSSYVLPIVPNVDTIDSQGTDAISGHVDTISEIPLTANDEVLGGVLKCCADHPAIPDGVAPEIEEDPMLEPLCVSTTLIFPQPPRDVVIWKKPDTTITTPYPDNAIVKANSNELLVLNCSAIGSLPQSYIGWTAENPSGSMAVFDSFHSSDCPDWITDSDPQVTDPILKTVDTSKCIQFIPTYDHHMLQIICTAVHEANTVGIDAAVTLDLCVPCSANLRLSDVLPNGAPAMTGYTDGSTVTFRRLGAQSTRTLSCLNAGARGEPNIDVYILPAGADEEILLTGDNTEDYYFESRELYIANDNTYGADKYKELYYSRVDVTLKVQGDFQIDGATIRCRCTNGIYGGLDDTSIAVTLTVFDQPATEANTAIQVNGQAVANLGSTTVLTTTATQPDPQGPPNNQLPAADLTADVPALTNRKKRQTLAQDDEITCIAYGTKPAVDFIWKLDDQVISGGFIETVVSDSVLNVGVGQGLLDTTSTFTFDPVHRDYHSKELCCEVSSSDLGSPIRRCTNLVVFSPPNSPLELSGLNVVNEGSTVQLQCAATEHYPSGVFQWDDTDGSLLLQDEAQTQTQYRVLPDYRLEQWSSYSFIASREHNGRSITCAFEQNYNEDDIEYEASTSGEIQISVNFCPASNAQLTRCPAAPIAPGQSVTISCESAVTNPAARLDWYLNNVKQSPSGDTTTQARDYGYVTIQSFTTRQLGLADDGFQLQCCPTHLTEDIGCGQLCSGVCTVRVEQPPAEQGCEWVRVQVTLENIDGNEAIWITDYSNTLSSAYRDLTSGLADVFRQIFDDLPDYESAIVATIEESADGRVQVIVGLEFDSPYRSTTAHIDQALSDATNSNGNLVYDGGNASPYDILLNSATAVCVCPSGFCVRGPNCIPDEDFSSSCSCPPTYAPPRCDVFVPPTDSTLPPNVINGIAYGRLVFVLGEIDNVPAIWSDDYDSLTDADTQDLINGLDTALTNVYSPEFNCFQNIRIADLFRADGGYIGVVAGVEFTSDDACDDTVDDIRTTFLENVDSDQRIGNSIFELDSDFLSETTVEEVCGSDYSCSNGGWCVPSDTLYYNSCQCPQGYAGSRCQTLIDVPSTTPDPIGKKGDTSGLNLSTTALIGIIIGVVLFAAILIGLCLLCCFLCGDRERVRTRVVYTDDDEQPPPRRGYGTPPRNQYAEKNGTYPKRRGEAVDDWPWASDGRPPVAYNRDTFDLNRDNRDTFDLNFDQRQGARMGPRPLL